MEGEGGGAPQHKAPEIDASLSPSQRGFAASHKSEKKNVKCCFCGLFALVLFVDFASSVGLSSFRVCHERPGLQIHGRARQSRG